MERNWWIIHGNVIMEMMRRVQQGEDPELVYIEYDANSDQIPVTEEPHRD